MLDETLKSVKEAEAKAAAVLQKAEENRDPLWRKQRRKPKP